MTLQNIAVARPADRGRLSAQLIHTGEPLKIEIHHNMAPLEREWRALESDPLVSVHQTYDWCAVWIQAFGTEPLIVKATIGEQKAFILPLEVVRAGGYRTARFIGTPHSNINTGIFSRWLPEDFKLSADVLVEGLKQHADLLLLQKVPAEWRGAVSPLLSLPTVQHQNSAFQLPMRESFEATLAQLSAKRRRKRNRHQRRLLDEAGGFDHVVGREADEQALLLQRFLAQKAARFRSAGMPDVFKDHHIQNFLKALASSKPAATGDQLLQMHGLRLKGEFDGEYAAIAAVSRKGDHVICQFASIDDSFIPGLSAGEMLFWLMIETFQTEGVAIFDFGLGDQLYKRSWCPQETVHRDVVLALTTKGKLAAAGQQAATRIKAKIKGNPFLYKQIQRLRANRQLTEKGES